jgi:hypothetical protein
VRQLQRATCAALAVAVAIFGFATNAQAKDGLNDRLLALLYPQSVGWTTVSKLPHPPAALLEDPVAVEELGGYEPFRPQSGCNPLIRMFVGHHVIDGFHVANLYGAGNSDLIYTGNNPCAEGDWTVIWRNGVHLAKGQPPTVLGTIVWRILPGSELKAVTVSAGCCDDPWTYYCLYDPVSRDVCTAAGTELVLPETAKPDRQTITVGKAVKLETSPARTEARDPDDPYKPPARDANTQAEQFVTLQAHGHIFRLVRVVSSEGEFAWLPHRPQYVLGWISDP